MKARTLLLGLGVCLAAAGLLGCKRNIVRAAPPSVAAPSAALEPQPVPEIVTPEDETRNTPALETLPVPAPEEVSAPRPAPARSRPPAVEAAKPKEPEAPQISPQLSSAQLADAQRRTTDDIRVAERNLQLADGKRLNASQKDLAEKVQGFLSQAHEAIRATDWVRAQNLAQKAQVLSVELNKSF